VQQGVELFSESYDTMSFGFLEEGARVAISGRNQTTIDEAVLPLGKDVLAVRADTAELGEVEKFLGTVKQKFGKIDILFINAGVAKFAHITRTRDKSRKGNLLVMVQPTRGYRSQIASNTFTFRYF